MNKTITMFKCMGAVLLCLSMLCGVIMSSIVLPTVAATPSDSGTPQGEVETFDVNFADLAVGFESGGKVTFLLGDGEPVVISGFIGGTPTGVYNLRVRACGKRLRHTSTVRSVQNVPYLQTYLKKGMLSFGFAGQEGGVEGITITRLNKNGATVNYNAVITEVETFETPVVVPVYGNPYDQTLPAAVKVYKDDAWVDSPMYWDPDSADFTVTGEGYIVGYLKETNDVRTEHRVEIGTHNRAPLSRIPSSLKANLPSL